MTVKLPKPDLAGVKSRNIKRYVRALLTYRRLQAATLDAKAAVAVAEAALRGGQRAEAERWLKAQ
jgi:Tfp pilus assembly protein PilX